MAGIGFELRKVISRGGISTFLGAAFSGVMIVAGPWLFSIVGISFIQRFVQPLGAVTAQRFLGVVIYSYAWSLVIFGGIHFLYTRMVADLLYEKKESRAAGTLVFFLVPIAALSAILAAAFGGIIGDAGPHKLLLRVAAVLLFTCVNCIWLLMIFISLLRWYLRILAVYLGGMALSVVLVRVLSEPLGIAGAVLGFAGGHVAIAALLLVLGVSAHRPRHIMQNRAALKRYIRNFPRLFACGFIYYWGIWVDKIVYWFTAGAAVPGSRLMLFPEYDVAVYIANLTMIPGLVYFIVAAETTFYVRLRKFLVSLSTATFAQIQRRKSMLIGTLNDGIARQSTFQGVFTAVLTVVAPAITTLRTLSATTPQTMRITLIAVFFHLLFLTLVNYQFYLEFYTHALLTCAIFCATNTLVSILAGTGIITVPAGLSYLAGGVAASAFAFTTTYRSMATIERRILARASGLS